MSQSSPTSSAQSPRRGCWTRLLIVVAIGFLLLVVGLIVWLFVSEGRGKAAWAAFKAEWEAKGEVFDWRASVPPELEEASNFATHPVVVQDQTGLNPALDLQQLPNVAGRGSRRDWTSGQTFSFRSLFRESARPEAEEEAIEIFDAFAAEREGLLAQLGEAARRPGCRFDFDYETDGFFGLHTTDVLTICREGSMILEGRGLSSLRSDRLDAAFEDWETIARLSRHMDQGPGLIHGLVSLVCSQNGLQILWEGLRTQQWEDSHLERAEALLTQFDFHGSAMRHFREERAGFIFILEECLIRRKQLPPVFRAPGSGFGGLEKMPKGWIYRNLVSYCGFMQRHLLAPRGELTDRIDYAGLRDAERELAGRRLIGGVLPNPHHLFVVMSMPSLEGSAGVILRGQAQIDLARLAVANERYRLRTGSHAENLSDLALDPLPLDPVTGGPYIYRFKDDGSPLIYSMGANREGDGGETAEDWRHGDWVWKYGDD